TPTAAPAHSTSVQTETTSTASRDIRVIRDDVGPSARRKPWLMVIPALVIAVVVSVGIGRSFLPVKAPARNFNPGDTFSECDACPIMNVLPAGDFVMGVEPETPTQSTWQTPAHPVALVKPFAVGKFEVTNGQYAQFLTALLQDGKVR